jgi:hypothetical protein
MTLFTITSVQKMKAIQVSQQTFAAICLTSMLARCNFGLKNLPGFESSLLVGAEKSRDAQVAIRLMFSPPLARPWGEAMHEYPLMPPVRQAMW